MFLKEKALELIPKYGRSKAETWPLAVTVVEATIIFALASHFK